MSRKRERKLTLIFEGFESHPPFKSGKLVRYAKYEAEER